MLYKRVYRKGMLIRGRFMEVQAREEVRCMFKRSACRGTKSLMDYRAYIPSFDDVANDCIVFFKSVRGLILSPLSFCTNFFFLLRNCTLLRERE
jgi:hypothetical protein